MLHLLKSHSSYEPFLYHILVVVRTCGAHAGNVGLNLTRSSSQLDSPYLFTHSVLRVLNKFLCVRPFLCQLFMQEYTQKCRYLWWSGGKCEIESSLQMHIFSLSPRYFLYSLFFLSTSAKKCGSVSQLHDLRALWVPIIEEVIDFTTRLQPSRCQLGGCSLGVTDRLNTYSDSWGCNAQECIKDFSHICWVA